MQDYDVTLKLLLQGTARRTIHMLAGTDIRRWMDAQLPKVQNLRADLLGEGIDGSIIHLELQSTNDPNMPARMFDYCHAIYRVYRRFPRQILVYVGQAPLRMPSQLCGPDQFIRYQTVDMRELDAEELLASEDADDQVMAILANLKDHRAAVRRILRKLAGLEGDARRDALQKLLILAGLWHLEETIEEEEARMPIETDIMEHKIVAREYRRGREEGREEGQQIGELAGEIALLHRQMERRFGSVPAWVMERLAGHSPAELIDIGVRLIGAQSFEDLFRP